MKRKLKELQGKIKNLSLKADFSDEDGKEVKKLMAEADNLEAQLEAQGAVAKAEAEEKNEAYPCCERTKDRGEEAEGCNQDDAESC